MVTIQSFEDLIVWQKARIWVKEIYDITSRLPKEEKFGLTDQLRRAAVSVMANIAEGFSRYHLAETMMFYRNARGSLTEVKSHLYLALDQGFITRDVFDKLRLQIDEIGKMLNGLLKASKNYRYQLSSKL